MDENILNGYYRDSEVEVNDFIESLLKPIKNRVGHHRYTRLYEELAQLFVDRFHLDKKQVTPYKFIGQEAVITGDQLRDIEQELVNLGYLSSRLISDRTDDNKTPRQQAAEWAFEEIRNDPYGGTKLSRYRDAARRYFHMEDRDENDPELCKKADSIKQLVRKLGQQEALERREKLKRQQK